MHKKRTKHEKRIVDGIVERWCPKRNKWVKPEEMGINKGKFRKGLCERKDDEPCDGTECDTCENHQCPTIKMIKKISNI